MNTKRITFLLVLVSLFTKTVANSQNTYQWGVLPSVNLNHKLKNDWSLNTKIEGRHLFQSGEINGVLFEKNNYVLTDFSLIVAKKVGLNSRVGAGYLIRVEGAELYHRFIQQYIIVQKLSGFRIAHRFLADQTISESERPQFRIRYRMTTEIPLNGESVDSKEFYVKLNNEYVNSLQAREYDLEIRFIPLLGYGFSNILKMETGLDYRVNSFLQNTTRNSYWMTLNVFIELD